MQKYKYDYFLREFKNSVENVKDGLFLIIDKPRTISFINMGEFGKKDMQLIDFVLDMTEPRYAYFIIKDCKIVKIEKGNLEYELFEYRKDILDLIKSLCNDEALKLLE